MLHVTQADAETPELTAFSNSRTVCPKVLRAGWFEDEELVVSLVSSSGVRPYGVRLGRELFRVARSRAHHVARGHRNPRRILYRYLKEVGFFGFLATIIKLGPHMW